MSTPVEFLPHLPATPEVIADALFRTIVTIGWASFNNKLVLMGISHVDATPDRVRDWADGSFAVVLEQFRGHPFGAELERYAREQVPGIAARIAASYRKNLHGGGSP